MKVHFRPRAHPRSPIGSVQSLAATLYERSDRESKATSRGMRASQFECVTADGADVARAVLCAVPVDVRLILPTRMRSFGTA